MSGHAIEKKSPAQRVFYAFALAILFTVMFESAHLVPRFTGGIATIGAVGFLLLAGTLFSELGEIIGLPHLTGYLLAGIIAGPFVLHLIDHDTVTRLSMVDRLALSLIALAGGAELKLDMVKKGIKSLAWATLIQCLAGLILMTGVFIACSPLIPFTQALTLMQLCGVGLLWGMLAITRSPSACLGILSQTRAEGPIARFSLAFIMSSDVVVVVLLAGVMTLARPLISPDASFSLAVFSTLGKEILGSIALGTTIGLALAAYLHLWGKQLLVVFIVLGFGVNEGINYIHFEPLLAFLVAGFVVQNFSKHGGRFLEAIEQTGGVVYVIFFASAGAHLDITLLKTLWPVALVLCGTRAAITYGASRFAARLAGDPPVVEKWAFSGLISQAGIALGIASLIVREFPQFGSGFSALAIAAVAINEMIGPIIFKLALDKNRESKSNEEGKIDVGVAAPPAAPEH
ncbi:MAG: cation:proton antiporter [Polyangiaceae bacterium]